MENNQKEKKNNKGLIATIIVLLIIIILMCIYYFTNIFNNSLNNETLKDNTNNQSQNETTTSIDNNPQYINYTYMDKIFTSDNGVYMELKVEDGKLLATIDGSTLKINNIEGKVKSFIVDHLCDGKYKTMVLTEDNNIFIESHNANQMSFSNADGTRYIKRFDKNSALDFEKLNLNKEIIDITEYSNAGYGHSCGNYDFAVVTTTGEINPLYRPNIKSEKGDYTEGNYTIGNLDYRQIKAVVHPIVIYQDNTISNLLDDPNNGPIGNKLTYNNKELLVNKFFDIKTNDTDIKNYLISDNKLYELISKRTDNYSLKYTTTNISLVSSSLISTESLNTKSGLNEYADDTNNTITFEDGTKFEINDINRIYDNR